MAHGMRCFGALQNRFGGDASSIRGLFLASGGAGVKTWLNAIPAPALNFANLPSSVSGGKELAGRVDGLQPFHKYHTAHKRHDRR
jgi:hypothetical protein